MNQVYFITLTESDGSIYIINPRYIISMITRNNGTYLYIHDGITKLVKETPKEIESLIHQKYLILSN